MNMKLNQNPYNNPNDNQEPFKINQSIIINDQSPRINIKNEHENTTYLNAPGLNTSINHQTKRTETSIIANMDIATGYKKSGKASNIPF